MSIGISASAAPELRVPFWIDGQGSPIDPVKLADLGDGYKVIYCFQHWCPGCHSRGFPTLKRLVDNLSDKGFGFIASSERGKDLFFHVSAVKDGAFESLFEGQSVEYEMEAGPKGDRASVVIPA